MTNIFESMDKARRNSQQSIDVFRAVGMGAEIAQYAKLAEKMFLRDPKEPEAICIQRSLSELHNALVELDEHDLPSDEKERQREDLIRATLDSFNELGARVKGGGGFFSDAYFRGTMKERIAQKYGAEFLDSIESMGSND